MESKEKCAEYLKDLGKALMEETGIQDSVVKVEHDVHGYYKKMGFYIHVQTYPAFSDMDHVTLAAFLSTEPTDSHSAQVGWLLQQSDYKWGDMKKAATDLKDTLWKQYPSLVGEKE